MLNRSALRFSRQALSPLLMTLLMTLCYLPTTASAVEKGLTPSHVYGLWTNINSATLTLAAQYNKGDSEWLNKVHNQQAAEFSDKTSDDVLQQVRAYQAKLNSLRAQRSHAAKSQAASKSNDKSTDQQAAVEITSSMVFLDTGELLDSLVGTILTELAADELISPYFKTQSFSGKTSSDVYGLVEMANRRLDQIVNKASL